MPPVDLNTRIISILTDFAEKKLNIAEAEKALVSLNVDHSIHRMMNLCKDVKKVRDIQGRYFLTKDSKVLEDSKRLEKELDKKIDTFFKIANERQSPPLPFVDKKLNHQDAQNLNISK